VEGKSGRGSGYDPQRHGPRRVVARGFHEQVWSKVSEVPRGAVTTFGDVAAALGLRSVARQVGWALAALPAARQDVPWHRVVDAQGRPSRRGDGRPSRSQLVRLAAEGVRLDAAGRVQAFAERRHRFGGAAPHAQAP